MSEHYDFEYLIEKIRHADFENAPFKHLYIEKFFNNEHFTEIQKSSEICAPVAANDFQLIDKLIENGFKIIPFPGCVTNIKKYVSWHSHGKQARHHTACEGFGMALRLFTFKSPIIIAINEFITSKAFNSAIAQKFGINYEDCIVDGGIQKYLDGYEISPHPDIRKKAATFMVNINPSVCSEEIDYHTKYLRLKPSRKYVEALWEGNSQIDRAWVPWDWSETVKQQNQNNSIVLFSPSNDTFHGVKADYDHLSTQRTQLYGNLWYREVETSNQLEWESLDLLSEAKIKYSTKRGLGKMITGIMPDLAVQTLKTVVRGGASKIGKRNV